MHPCSVLSASLLAISLMGCAPSAPPPPSAQLTELTKERDRERAQRVEAETARHKAEGRVNTVMSWAVVGGAAMLFLGIALGSSAARRSREPVPHAPMAT